MSLFSALKDDYLAIVNDCKAHLRAINESSSPLEQERLLKEASDCIQDAEGVVCDQAILSHKTDSSDEVDSQQRS